VAGAFARRDVMGFGEHAGYVVTRSSRRKGPRATAMRPSPAFGGADREPVNACESGVRREGPVRSTSNSGGKADITRRR
jgi:hypothetical protein